MSALNRYRDIVLDQFLWMHDQGMTPEDMVEAVRPGQRPRRIGAEAAFAILLDEYTRCADDLAEREAQLSLPFSSNVVPLRRAG